MATKVFLDTNIVLDILDNKRPTHSSAIILYQQIISGNVSAYISETVFTTTDYLLQKTVSKSIRIVILTEILNHLKILSCNSGLCKKALTINFPDLEDALLYQIALENKIDYFISNDKAALKKLTSVSLPAISTKDFLTIND